MRYENDEYKRPEYSQCDLAYKQTCDFIVKGKLCFDSAKCCLLLHVCNKKGLMDI